MADVLFPDNTVLCNFACIRQLELLRDWLRGRGRWTYAVEREARRSHRVIAGMDSLFIERWLGESIETTATEERYIQALRRAGFGGTDERRTEHLGEASPLVVIERREEFRGAWWITDDGEAYRLAKRKGITPKDTHDVMEEPVAEGTLTAATAFDHMHAMAAQDNHLRLPNSPRDLQ